MGKEAYSLTALIIIYQNIDAVVRSSPLDTCKIKLEFFYNMFSGFGTTIESAATINSEKAVVIQE